MESANHHVVASLDKFTVLSVNVVGPDHAKKFDNGQDAFLTSRVKLDKPAACGGNDFLIGVVSDGCGSSARSDVGSKLISSFLIRAVTDRLCLSKNKISTDEFWAEVKNQILNAVEGVTACMHMAPFYNLADYFMATLVGYVVSPTTTVLFNIGDGYFIINGMVIQLPPRAGNYPDYIAYNMVSGEEKREFNLRTYSTATIKTLVVATDGFKNVLDAHGKNFPGEVRLVPDFSQVGLIPDLCWANENLLQGCFNLMASPQARLLVSDGKTRMVKHPPLLGDDVTMIALVPTPPLIPVKTYGDEQ